MGVSVGGVSSLVVPSLPCGGVLEVSPEVEFDDVFEEVVELGFELEVELDELPECLPSHIISVRPGILPIRPSSPFFIPCLTASLLCSGLSCHKIICLTIIRPP